MPVIDSKKYACEPCIRGHRATKCSHTTRLQVLVRKPGRPMQNCAHEFGACVCGRIGEVGEDWGADGDESRKNVLKTKSKKEKEKVKKGGTSDVQKSKVKKRAKGPTSSSQSNSCPPSICKVSGQQEVIEHSSDIQPESIDILDPTYPKIPIPSSTSIPTISNFLPTITTLLPQVQDHTILSSQMLYNDQSPTLIFHQHQNDQASLRTPFSTPFLRY
ncbi:putative grisea protein [Botrytis cinerea BcDW1]|uniref:Putative grisea protein n=1 Tax=Botryotinia fuckeliana (strain BcDW1) TaxID=1290391 RepID=M7UU90_BOTF1|nr:putative grisea protein [Botrytis cinerea BcDW1]